MERVCEIMKDGLPAVNAFPATNSPGVLEHGKESKLKEKERYHV
jgi:hypothetical protein